MLFVSDEGSENAELVCLWALKVGLKFWIKV